MTLPITPKEKEPKFFSDILGGPVKYTGRELKSVHIGMGITKDAFSEVADLLEETLEDFEVEDDDIETIMKIVAGIRPDVVTVQYSMSI